MSDPTPASVPAGWYPSPDGGPRRRWWNGVAWTADLEQPAAQQPAAPFTPPGQSSAPFTPPGQTAAQQPATQQPAYQHPATPHPATQQSVAPQPYGTAASAPASAARANVNTPWIWLIALMPIIPIIANALIDYSPLILADPADPAAQFDAQFAVYTSPAYLIGGFGGFLVYGLSVLFAFLDRRELLRRSIDRPFHWAWTFLTPIVYSIGRAVIVRRRTGTGYAPMVAAIGVYVLGVVIAGFTVAAFLIGVLNNPAYML